MKRTLLFPALLVFAWAAAPALAATVEQVEADYVDIGELTLKSGEAIIDLRVQTNTISDAAAEVYGERLNIAGDANTLRLMYSALASGDDEKFWNLTKDGVRDRLFGLFTTAMTNIEAGAAEAAAASAPAGGSYNAQLNSAATRTLSRFFVLRNPAEIRFAGLAGRINLWLTVAKLVADYVGTRFDNHMINKFMRDYTMLRLEGYDRDGARMMLIRGEPQLIEAFRRAYEGNRSVNVTPEFIYTMADENLRLRLQGNERFKQDLHERAREMREKLEARFNRQLAAGLDAAQRDVLAMDMLVKYRPEEANEARRKLAWERAMGDGGRYRAVFQYYQQRNEEIRVEKAKEEQEYAANRSALQDLYATLFDSSARLAYDPDRPNYAPAETYQAADQYPPYLGARVWPWEQNVNDGTIANYFIANLRKVFIETIYKAPDRALAFGNAQVMTTDYLKNFRTFKYMAFAILNDAYTIATQYAGQKRYRLSGSLAGSADYLIEVVDVPIYHVRCPVHFPEGRLSREEDANLNCCSSASKRQVSSVREEHWGTRYWWDPFSVDYWPYKYRNRDEATREGYVRGVRVNELYRHAATSRNGYVLRDPLRASPAGALQPNLDVFARCETRECADGMSREEAMNRIFKPVAQAYIACLTDFKQRYRDQEDALKATMESLRNWRELTRRNVNPKYDRMFRHGSGVYGLTEAAGEPLRRLQQAIITDERSQHGDNAPTGLGAQAYNVGQSVMFRMVQQPGNTAHERVRVEQAVRRDLDAAAPAARSQALAAARAGLQQYQQEIRQNLPTDDEIRAKQVALQAALRETTLQAGDPYERERLQAMGLPVPGATDVYGELPQGEVAELVFADERAAARWVPGGYQFDYGSGVNATAAAEQGREIVGLQRDVDDLQYRAEMLGRLADAYGAVDASLQNLESEYAFMLGNRAQFMQALRRWLQEDNPELTNLARQAQQPELARAADRLLGALRSGGATLPATPPYANLTLAENRIPRLGDIRDETARAQAAALAGELDRQLTAGKASLDAAGARYGTIRDNYGRIVEMLALYRPTGPELAGLVRELNAEGFDPARVANWDDFDRQARARLALLAFTPDDLAALQRLQAKLTGGTTSGSVQADMTALVEKTLAALALAYENQSVGSFMRLVDQRFNSPLTNAKDYRQLEQSLRDDFRNFTTTRLWLYLRGRPSWYPERRLVAIDCTWSRKLIIRRTGEEWEVRNQQTQMVFSVQDDGSLRLLNVERGDVLFGLSDYRGRVVIDEGTINGQTVTTSVALENGGVVTTGGAGSTGTAASSTVTSGSANNVTMGDGAGWWTYSFMAPGYFTNTAIATREASFNLRSPGDGTLDIAGYKNLPGGVQLLGLGSIDAYTTVPTAGYDAGVVTAAAGQVYAVKTTTGKYVKVKITALTDNGGDITVSFDWRFQNNGTPDF